MGTSDILPGKTKNYGRKGIGMKCEIIQDLLPSYIDGLTSEASNQEIEKHIEHCDTCRGFLQGMKKSIATNAVELEDTSFMQMIRRIKRVNFEKSILAVAVVVCILVTISYGISSYMFGHKSVLPEEVRIACRTEENTRKLIFHSNKEDWHIVVSYHGTPYDTQDEALLELGLLKYRYWDGPIEEYSNTYSIEFVDEDTFVVKTGDEKEYIDFDDDDFLSINLSGREKHIFFSELYNNELQGFIQ